MNKTFEDVSGTLLTVSHTRHRSEWRIRTERKLGGYLVLLWGETGLFYCRSVRVLSPFVEFP